jgi:hypothetical protein
MKSGAMLDARKAPPTRLGARRAALCLLVGHVLAGCGGDDVESDESAIIGGVPATAYPEAVSINALAAELPTLTCSGVLIAPRAVLTAGHCVDRYRGWGVYAPYAGGQGAMSYDAVTYDWTSGMTFSFEQHDVAIVFLPEDFVIDSYPVIKPEPLDNGTSVVTIGRVNNGFIADEAMFVSQPFPVYQDLGLEGVSHPYAYGTLHRIIQKGDSGGPAMLPESTPHELVALNSAMQFLARLDLVHDWIAEQVASHAGPTD